MAQSFRIRSFRLPLPTTPPDPPPPPHAPSGDPIDCFNRPRLAEPQSAQVGTKEHSRDPKTDAQTEACICICENSSQGSQNNEHAINMQIQTILVSK